MIALANAIESSLTILFVTSAIVKFETTFVRVYQYTLFDLDTMLKDLSTASSFACSPHKACLIPQLVHRSTWHRS